MRIQFSGNLDRIIEKALMLSAGQGQFYVGVEHLYLAVMDHADELPEKFGEKYTDALLNVARAVGRTVWRGSAGEIPNEAFHSPRCINVIQQATRLANRCGQESADAGFLLCALLADNFSAPSRVMDAMKLDRAFCVKMLFDELGMAGMRARETGSTKEVPTPHKGRAGVGIEGAARKHGHGTDASRAKGPVVQGAGAASITRDLNELALDGKLQPAIDRDEEIGEIFQVLARKSKNNVMLVGEAGVGKTQIVEGMAWMMARDASRNNTAPAFRILELNIAALMSGTQYRGAFEEKVLALLDELKNDGKSVLFIDEAHLIMGAGAVEGDGMNLANLLKPALSRGEIRCIGATTIREYRKFVEQDPAVERRFQMVRVEEMSEEATGRVLERVVPALEAHHEVRITTQAAEAAVKLSQRHMPNRCLPDKVIDVLDQACARFRLKLMTFQNDPKMLENTLAPSADEGVTPHDIRKVVSRMTAIPIEEMTAEERMHLGAVEKRIRKRLIGQDEAVARAVAAVKKSRAGLADPNRPDAVLLFLGPSGVGKTQLAKLLAEHVFGSANHLIAFDMSEYIEEHSVSRLLGAPPRIRRLRRGGTPDRGGAHLPLFHTAVR